MVRFAIIFIIALLITTGFVPIACAAGDELLAAPINPQFVRYVHDNSLSHSASENTDHLGFSPSPIYRPEIRDIQLFDTPTRDQLTSDQTSFDLRTEGTVSPVKDQGNFGTCWAFATYGSLESTLMPANPTSDFSEKNLANRAGFPDSSDPNHGGDIGMSAAYLTRWNGPVNESTDPYPTGAWTTSGTYPSVYHIQNIVYFPGRTNRSDTTNIKEALTRWGAVFSSFYWANTFYNTANTAYYQPPTTSDNQPGGGGHAVTIVGWDDTFAASNFNTPPLGNGAWIVKNSWGTGWGRSGYFYMSYYDKYFGSAVMPSTTYTTAVVLGETTANYDTVYYYDRQGEVKDYSYATTRTGGFANVFTANTTEIVTAIGFYTTDVNVTCNISIYTNPTYGPIGAAPAALYNTTLPYMGYNTVTLPPDQRVPVTAGTNFSVVLQVTTPTNDQYIPVEETLEGYSGGITSKYGQGYLLGSGGWVDLKTFKDNSHVCVKAYTRSSAVAPVASFTGTPTVGTAPLTVTFTDSSTNTPTNWNWNFGDGNVSNAKNPVHTYVNAGNHTVSLTATNAEGSNTTTMTNYITVSSPPVSSLTVGIFRSGTFYLASSNSMDGGTVNAFSFGQDGDLPVAGDWTGSGTTTVGIYRNGTFHLASSNSMGGGTVNAFSFGQDGDVPVAGDWTGNGTTTVGIYRRGTFYLASSNSQGGGTVNAFSFGQDGDLPVAGDWTGNGTTTVGIYRTGIFYLASSNSPGGGSLNVFPFGIKGDKPVSGDWNGDGTTEGGIFRNGTFYLASSNSSGGEPVNVFGFGTTGDTPVAGMWTA